MNNKKATTKVKIINAAIKLIALNGFNATTTASIAKEAGISDTIIFKYFRDKQTLLREIVQQAMGQLLDNIDITALVQKVELSKDFPTRDFLKIILMDRFEFMESNFELVKIVLMEMQYNEELMVLVENKLFEKSYEIVDLIEQLIAGKMGITIERARTVLRICFGTVVTFVIQKHLLSVRIDCSMVEKEIDNVLDIIMVSSAQISQSSGGLS
ncbi:MAG TPA: TetR family transcriptional regulator [Firmicutes bacterium]|jgi:AcrR family transcriptional regulator|nr:TetR family transcriptional regulator [Bacillota bacterium]